MSGIIPYKFTGTFNRKIRELFYVSNFSAAMEHIKRQFRLGVAKPVEDGVYEVKIHSIPALVVMRDATLISVSYVR